MLFSPNWKVPFWFTKMVINCIKNILTDYGVKLLPFSIFLNYVIKEIKKEAPQKSNDLCEASSNFW